MPSARPPRSTTTSPRPRVAPVVVGLSVAALSVGGALLIERAPQTQAPAAMAVPAVPVSVDASASPWPARTPPASGTPRASATPTATLPAAPATSATPPPPTSAAPAPTTAAPEPAPTQAPTTSAAEPTTTATVAPTTDASAPLRVDATWARATANATGIPERALIAYATADLLLDQERPGCYFGWNTVAAIGLIESRHGSFGGAVLGADGQARPAIVGIPLNGVGVARISDSDGGRLDGDATWDRAVGPMQFIPTTWARWGADGNGDGVRDPQQIDDAALAAGRYLCASNAMNTPEGWRRAVLSYNNSNAYVTKVAETANRYAQAVLAE